LARPYFTTNFPIAQLNHETTHHFHIQGIEKLSCERYVAKGKLLYEHIIKHLPLKIAALHYRFLFVDDNPHRREAILATAREHLISLICFDPIKPIGNAEPMYLNETEINGLIRQSL
tara:strand:+ start:38649 stop:38999 length:351 start_codon:yes stop_codon:yes gene_type:complete